MVYYLLLALARNQFDRKWRYYDDTNVKEINDARRVVSKGSPYLLFYNLIKRIDKDAVAKEETTRAVAAAAVAQLVPASNYKISRILKIHLNNFSN